MGHFEHESTGRTSGFEVTVGHFPAPVRFLPQAIETIAQLVNTGSTSMRVSHHDEFKGLGFGECHAVTIFQMRLVPMISASRLRFAILPPVNF